MHVLRKAGKDNEHPEEQAIISANIICAIVFIEKVIFKVQDRTDFLPCLTYEEILPGTTI